MPLQTQACGSSLLALKLFKKISALLTMLRPLAPPVCTFLVKLANSTSRNFAVSSVISVFNSASQCKYKDLGACKACDLWLSGPLWRNVENAKVKASTGSKNRFAEGTDCSNKAEQIHSDLNRALAENVLNTQ